MRKIGISLWPFHPHKTEMASFGENMAINELTVFDSEKVSIKDVFLNDNNKAIVTQLLKEHLYLDELGKYGLSADNKILLHGPSGCGKTMLAKALATSLGKRLVIANLSTLVNSKIGETSRNIKQLFDHAGRQKSVLFLDEFDQIGKLRATDEKDVGEMRRLVNTIIQLMDYLPKECLLICATNHQEIIDGALLRRFQLKLEFSVPNEERLNEYYDSLLAIFPDKLRTIPRKYDISYAEAKDYTLTIMKRRILEDVEKNTNQPKC